MRIMVTPSMVMAVAKAVQYCTLHIIRKVYLCRKISTAKISENMTILAIFDS